MGDRTEDVSVVDLARDYLEKKRDREEKRPGSVVSPISRLGPRPKSDVGQRHHFCVATRGRAGARQFLGRPRTDAVQAAPQDPGRDGMNWPWSAAARHPFLRLE